MLEKEIDFAAATGCRGGLEARFYVSALLGGWLSARIAERRWRTCTDARLTSFVREKLGLTARLLLLLSSRYTNNGPHFLTESAKERKVTSNMGRCLARLVATCTLTVLYFGIKKTS